MTPSGPDLHVPTFRVEGVPEGWALCALCDQLIDLADFFSAPCPRGD